MTETSGRSLPQTSNLISPTSPNPAKENSQHENVRSAPAVRLPAARPPPCLPLRCLRTWCSPTILPSEDLPHQHTNMFISHSNPLLSSPQNMKTSWESHCPCLRFLSSLLEPCGDSQTWPSPQPQGRWEADLPLPHSPSRPDRRPPRSQPRLLCGSLSLRLTFLTLKGRASTAQPSNPFYAPRAFLPQSRLVALFVQTPSV